MHDRGDGQCGHHSRTVFAFLPAVGNAAFGRTLHLLSAYWGFMCMALHLGVNWRMVIATMQRGYPTLKKHGKPLAIGVLAVSVYGIFAFSAVVCRTIFSCAPTLSILILRNR